MFSIVIPLYNKESCIKRTIQSVLDQSFPSFEVIVVDDGSTDNSLLEVKKLEDSRIRIINKLNGGVSSARNRGIEEAKYQWIAFLDGDDLWEFNHLEVVYEMLREYPSEMVFCTSYVRSDHPIPEKQNREVYVINDYFVRAKQRHFFWTSVAVINKKVFEDVGVFREDLSRGEDLDLWARIGRGHRFIKSSAVTAIYVQDSDNKITKSKFDYDKSVFVDIHYQIKEFLRQSEKNYYLQILINGAKSFFRRQDFKSGFKTLYRLFILIFIKVVGDEKKY